MLTCFQKNVHRFPKYFSMRVKNMFTIRIFARQFSKDFSPDKFFFHKFQKMLTFFKDYRDGSKKIFMVIQISVHKMFKNGLDS
jgi:hypothetical protein